MSDKYAALKQAAQIVAVGDWLYHDRQKLEHVGGGFLAIDGKESVFCLNSAVGGIKKGNDVVKYIAAANPSTVLALLDELEAAEKRIAELEAREVELPQRQEPTSSGHYGEGYLVPSNAGSALDYEETVEAIRAAGITVKGDSE